MFIVKRKVQRKKKVMIYYVLVKTIYKDGKPRQEVVRYLGTAERINEIFKKKDKKKKRRKNNR